MRLRNTPWRFLLPGVIFPMSIVTWVQYYSSVRASDDSPAPWYWYGGPLSAWLNFPAFVYSAPAQAFYRLGIGVGKLWIEPRIVTFFLLVFAFWYWVGTRVESWTAQATTNTVYEKPSRVMYVLYGLGAALWTLVAIGTVYDLVSMVHVSSWYGLRHLYRDSELMSLAQCLWSLILAVYYSRKFVLGFRARIAGGP
jgi:hypothetical protein